MIDHLQDAADAGECDLDLDVERMFQGYRLSRRAPSWRSPSGRCAPAATPPSRIVSGGASDVNSFMVDGLSSICLADGVQRNHYLGRAGRRPRRSRTCSTFALAIVEEAAVQFAEVTRMTGFEPVGARSSGRAGDLTVGVAHYRHADGALVARDKVWHPGRSGSSPSTTSTCG